MPTPAEATDTSRSTSAADARAETDATDPDSVFGWSDDEALAYVALDEFNRAQDAAELLKD